MSMSNIIPPRIQTHQRLPSDELKDDPAASSTELVPPSKWKGKGRAVEPISTDVESDVASRHEDDDDDEEEEGESSGLDPEAAASYPPTTEDENESRRIAENLRRWEAAERDKRRAARESKQLDADTGDGGGGSGGARGSWYLWNRHSTGDGRGGAGAGTDNPHLPLRGHSQDDGTSAPPTRPVSIDEADEPATPMPHTPGLSPATPTPFRADTGPFSDAHAAASTVSLGSALMEPSASIPSTPKAEPPPERPVLQASHASAAAISQPIVDEPFQTPPPRIVIPGQQDDDTELSTRSQAQRQRHQDQLEWQEQAQQERQGRWWTDWLCGCREDRHREQAGGTNPFE